MGEGEIAITARVRGRVQGVGFRWWTRDEAERLGLRGWVRNEADGSVSAAFRGPAPAVEAMRDALARGPRGAAVTGVEVMPATLAEVTDEGFRIRR